MAVGARRAQSLVGSGQSDARHGNALDACRALAASFEPPQPGREAIEGRGKAIDMDRDGEAITQARIGDGLATAMSLLGDFPRGPTPPPTPPFLSAERRVMSTDVQRTITHHRELVKSLKAEASTLTAELERELQTSEMAPTPRQAVEFKRLQESCDAFSGRIEVERQRSEELKVAIAGIRGKADAARVRMGGVDAVNERATGIDQRLRAIQDALEKEATKLNEAVADNLALRAKIDASRRERLRFVILFQRTERELERIRKQTEEALEAGTAALEARDEAHRMMAAMLAEGDRQTRAHDRAVAQMQGLVERDRQVMETERQKQLAVADLTADADVGGPSRPGGRRGGGGAARRGRAGRAGASSAPEDHVVERTVRLEKYLWGVCRAAGVVTDDGDGAGKDEDEGGGEGAGPPPSSAGDNDVEDAAERLLDRFSKLEEDNFHSFSVQRDVEKEVRALEDRLGRLRLEEAALRAKAHVDTVAGALAACGAEGEREEDRAAGERVRQRLERDTASLNALKAVVCEMAEPCGHFGDPAAAEAVGVGADPSTMTDAALLTLVGHLERWATETFSVFSFVRDRGAIAAAAEGRVADVAAPEEDDDKPREALFVNRPQDRLEPAEADVVPPSTVHVGPGGGLGGGEEDEMDLGRPLLAGELRATVRKFQ